MFAVLNRIPYLDRKGFIASVSMSSSGLAVLVSGLAVLVCSNHHKGAQNSPRVHGRTNHDRFLCGPPTPNVKGSNPSCLRLYDA